jgi:stage III sporulation protein AB
MLLKWMGAIMVMAAAAWGGGYAAELFRAEVRDLEQLLYMLTLLRSRMEYGMLVLPECLAQTADKLKPPLGNALNDLAQCLQMRDERSFEELWEKYLCPVLGQMRLKEEQKEAVLALADGLADPDLAMKRYSIAQCETALKTRASQCKGQLQNRLHLCHTLSVLVGIFLVVLLL